MKKVLSGESGDVVYTIGLGERLTTGSPVLIRGAGEGGSLLFDEEDKANLDIQYEPKSIIINADKGRVSQVISNLLSNAVKFTKGKGTISITTEKRNCEVTEPNFVSEVSAPM